MLLWDRLSRDRPPTVTGLPRCPENGYHPLQVRRSSEESAVKSMSAFTLGEFAAVIYGLLFAWWATYIQGRSWDEASCHGRTSWSFLWLGAICSSLAWTSAFATSILGGVGVLNWAFHNITPQDIKTAWRILETGTVVAFLSPVLGVVFSAIAYAISLPPSRSSALSGFNSSDSSSSSWWNGYWWGRGTGVSSYTPSPSSSSSTSSSLSGSSAAITSSLSGSSSSTTSPSPSSSGGGSGSSFDLGDNAWPIAIAIFVAALVLLALSLGIFVNVKLVKYYARKRDEIPADVRRAYGR